ncbi:hypothetical protein bcgnr5369_14720 [Bacillus cereus]|uniref:hypothetical protein n=1 Tax=Bacillus cereus group TaxID=86661 RepID=UPI001482D16B|nr:MULTISPECIES: hypothetical protein [Bacillus cereus group]
MKKGDIVVFIVGNDKTKYEVVSDEYMFLGNKVVDLQSYAGEVPVEYLKKV